MDSQEREMHATELTFRVGLAIGRALSAPPPPQLPQLEPGQRTVQMWSPPDWMGNRYLLTFELRELR